MNTVDWILPIGPGEDLAFTGLAIRSVCDQMKEYDRVLIICDCQTFDRLPVKLCGNVVHITAPAHCSAGAYRNCGLDAVRSDIVIFQDADDISLPERRNMTVNALTGIDKGIFSGGYFVMDEDGIVLGKRKMRGGNTYFWFRSNLFLPAAAVTKYIALTNRFEEGLSIGEDTVFFASALRDGAAAVRTDQAVIRYRLLSQKAKKKRGLAGIRSEIMFRRILLKRAPLAQSMMVYLGGMIAACIKLLPAHQFARLYRFFHGA